MAIIQIPSNITPGGTIEPQDVLNLYDLVNGQLDNVNFNYETFGCSAPAGWTGDLIRLLVNNVSLWSVTSSGLSPGRTVTYTTSGTLTLPAWAKMVQMVLIGGGGGGGGRPSSIAGSTGGGGVRYQVTAILSSVWSGATALTITVGSGGAGGASGVAGTAGTASSVTVSSVGFQSGGGAGGATGATGSATQGSPSLVGSPSQTGFLDANPGSSVASPTAVGSLNSSLGLGGAAGAVSGAGGNGSSGIVLVTLF